MCSASRGMPAEWGGHLCSSISACPWCPLGPGSSSGLPGHAPCFRSAVTRFPLAFVRFAFQSCCANSAAFLTAPAIMLVFLSASLLFGSCSRNRCVSFLFFLTQQWQDSRDVRVCFFLCLPSGLLHFSAFRTPCAFGLTPCREAIVSPLCCCARLLTGVCFCS